MLLLLAACIGVSVWLDVGAATASGRVIARTERVDVTVDGEWTRDWRLEVDFPPLHSLHANVSVDSAQFVRTRVGDSIRLHYLTCCPLFPRPVERTTLSWASKFGRDAVFVARWGLWLVAGIAALVISGKRGRAPVLVVGALWALAALALDRVHEAPLPLVGGQTAPARVQSVREIDWLLRPGRRSEGWQLTQPIDVVTFAFQPAPRTDSVVTADAIDAGSIRSLNDGGLHTIRFDPARPREAQLVDGSRSYPVRNRLDGIAVVGLTVVVLTGIAWIVASSRDKRQTRRMNASGASA